MAELFADTSGFGNLADPTQPFHSLAASLYRAARNHNRRVVTTNYVLAELVALMTSPLRFPRASIVAFTDDLKASPYVEVVHVDPSLDYEAWQLLKSRQDKEWSLVDCASFVLMTRRRISEALTTDHHFEQANLVRLFVSNRVGSEFPGRRGSASLDNLRGHPRSLRAVQQICRVNYPPMHATPASLLDRLRSPTDAEAWVRFVRLYTPFLYHWARKRGLSSDDTADLIQEVFAQLLKALPTFAYDPKRSFRAWLAVVVGNKWRELNRKRRPQTVPAADLAERPSPTDDFDDREYRSHIATRALKLIQGEIVSPTWQAFWAVVVEGQSANDVAKKLRLTPNAVYLARARVLRRLRAELAGLVD